MNKTINYCIMYSILRIINEENIFYDKDNPGKPTPIVMKHLDDLVKLCPNAPIDYIIKFEGKDDNKRIFLQKKSVKDVIRNYYEKYIVGRSTMPPLPPWETLASLDVPPSPLNNILSKRKNRKQTRKQRKSRKETRKQRVNYIKKNHT